MRRQSILSELEFVVSEDIKHLESAKRIYDHFYSLSLPRMMDSNNPQNILIRGRIEFDKLCVALMANGIQNPEKVSIQKFFAAVDYYEKKK